jgi:hypothetical protein
MVRWRSVRLMIAGKSCTMHDHLAYSQPTTRAGAAALIDFFLERVPLEIDDLNDRTIGLLKTLRGFLSAT